MDNPTEIKHKIVRFFQNFLSSTIPRPTPIDMDLLDTRQLIGSYVMTRKVSTSQCFDLLSVAPPSKPTLIGKAFWFL